MEDMEDMGAVEKESMDVITEPSESDSTPSVPERLGNIEKCPVCGSRVDAEAYHCPTCRNTFCFHCRARVSPSDYQYQCVNQQCDYYGKLLCDVCEEAVEQEQAPAVYMEPQEGVWPLLLVAVLVGAGYIWWWSSFGWATLWILTGFPLIGIGLQIAGLNIFGRSRRVEHRRKSRFHRCLCCQQPVKELTETVTGQNIWHGAVTPPTTKVDAIEDGFPGELE